MGDPPSLVLSGFVGLISSGVFGAFMVLPDSEPNAVKKARRGSKQQRVSVAMACAY